MTAFSRVSLAPDMLIHYWRSGHQKVAPRESSQPEARVSSSGCACVLCPSAVPVHYVSCARFSGRGTAES